MTLIIALVLLAHVDAHWLWYVAVFIVWLMRVAIRFSEINK